MPSGQRTMPLAVCCPSLFFEATVDGTEEAPIVVRTDDQGHQQLVPVTLTLSQIIEALGFLPPDAAVDTARTLEERLMEGWSTHEPWVWRHERVIGHDDRWAHLLGDRRPAERLYLENTHPYDMTKMGCARFLQVFGDDDRDTLWKNLDKSSLEVACGAAVGGRGRGRGRGRGADVVAGPAMAAAVELPPAHGHEVAGALAHARGRGRRGGAGRRGRGVRPPGGH